MSVNETCAPIINDLEAVRALGRALKARLVERDDAVDGLLAALVAGEHVLLIGPPGTAKSLLARLMCESLAGARWFQTLLTRFSTPEELFGPLDLSALEAGRYERLVDGYLPTAHVAFLDEVFKANSAILNALLTLLNERLFHNGGRALPVPLLTLVAASNELPDDDALMALHDRFLVRFVVEPIRSDRRFVSWLRDAEAPAALPSLDLASVHRLRARLPSVPVHEPVLELLARLRSELDRRGVLVSDRRWRSTLTYLRAVALLSGAPAVTPELLPHAECCLWNDPDDLGEVRAALAEAATGHDDEARRLLAQAREVVAFARRPFEDATDEVRAAIEAHAKLGRLLAEADRLRRLSEAQGAPSAVVDEVRETLSRLQAELLADE